MAHTTKISPEQVELAAVRIAAGEISIRKAAAEIGVSPIALKKRIDALGGKAEIKAAITTAKQGIASVVQARSKAAEEVAKTIELAPPRVQQVLTDWIADLNEIADSAMRGAKDSMKVFERVAAIAALQANRIDPNAPMESADQLQAIAGLTKIGNDARQAGMDILKLSQDEMQERRKVDTKQQTQIARVVIRPGATVND